MAQVYLGVKHPFQMNFSFS